MESYAEYERLRRDDKQAVLNRMLSEQGYKCALCGEWLRFQQRDSETMPVYDHDHGTGRLRGVLHGRCNRDLAAFENHPDWWHVRALEYLQHWGSRVPGLLADGNAPQPVNRVELALGTPHTKAQEPPPLSDAEIETAYRVLLEALGRVRSPFDPWYLYQTVLIGPVKTALDLGFDRIRQERRVEWHQGAGYRVVNTPTNR